MRLVFEPVLPGNVPRPLDHELLAWAAGFFDGEGSTIARRDRRRLGYYQLEISVPQKGIDGIPEVVHKFQRAMLGMGSVRPEVDSMYKWRARGRIAVPLCLALLWPWLGPVKRAQAMSAITAVREHQDRATRPPRYNPTLIAHPTPTPADATRLSLAWAAGFLDGEGSFGNPGTYERKDGTFGFRIRASATQHGEVGQPAEVLVRLRSILGGRIERHGAPDDHKWVREGASGVRDVVESLKPWLGSIKLAQAAASLVKSESNRTRGTSELCVRGHVYDRVV